jgi:hypothetical protein
MQRLKNKLHLMASVVMIYMVLKKKRERETYFGVEHGLAAPQVSMLLPELLVMI